MMYCWTYKATYVSDKYPYKEFDFESVLTLWHTTSEGIEPFFELADKSDSNYSLEYPMIFNLSVAKLIDALENQDSIQISNSKIDYVDSLFRGRLLNSIEVISCLNPNELLSVEVTDYLGSDLESFNVADHPVRNFIFRTISGVIAFAYVFIIASITIKAVEVKNYYEVFTSNFTLIFIGFPVIFIIFIFSLGGYQLLEKVTKSLDGRINRYIGLMISRLFSKLNNR